MSRRRLIAAVAAGLLLLLLLIPWLIPAGRWSAALESAAEAAGLTLTLEEPPSLSLLPRPTLSTAGFAIADGDEPWLEGEGLSVAVDVLPLFGGTVSIRKVVLDQPTVRLHAAPSGGEAKEGDGEPTLPGLHSVEVRGGLVLDTKGTVVEAADLDLSWPGPDEPIELSGAVTWQGEPVRFDGWVAQPLALASGEPTKLDLEASVPGATARIGGTAQLAGQRFDGTIRADGEDLHALMGWLGTEMTDEDSFRTVDLEGELQIRGTRWDLAVQRFVLDEQPLSGTVSLRLGAVPHVTADLTGRAVLDTWLGPGPPLKRSPPKGKRKTKAPSDGGEWSDEPLDLSALKRATGSVTLKLTEGAWGALPLAGTLRTTLKAGRLNTTLDLDGQAIPGSPAGRIEAVVSSGATPTIRTTGSLTSGDLGVQLDQLVAFDQLTGAGELSWDLSTRGGDVRALIGALTGDASLALTDGGLRRLDLGSLLGSLTATPQRSFETAVTPFQAATAQLRIRQGSIDVDDLSIDTVLARVTGGGSIDLAKQRVDLDLLAKLGARGRTKLPISVTGDFGDLTFTPEGTERLRERVEEVLGRELPKDRPLRDLLKTPGFRAR